jgi:hypothetical protein
MLSAFQALNPGAYSLSPEIHRRPVASTKTPLREPDETDFGPSFEPLDACQDDLLLVSVRWFSAIEKASSRVTVVDR